MGRPNTGICNVVKPYVGILVSFFGRCVSHLLGTLGLLPVSPSTGYQRNEGVKNVTDSGAWKRLG